ncbi:hypothetical protein COW80_04155 [Candidatus Beckwithbacteria bacterium CG22_combo_CG10-13_8_21_14_all_01_47_9]|uniref:Transcriptional regulator n=5 Tax=Candidatus Beckwithiibacteriota TaxID=1752726 RepID=A0A2H0E019_9BACT|nr:MAG: hypothetical protein AUJ59_00985 [Candidatus Beckwithbacteria bacterium CG1_02_47_37]PIP52697.1 MAG: hypothetical protein COX09_00145 [Candidatus Beckwithbacteria bacterium CG23_combo_of_CG06-09_8_20_14_all_47_9]PIP87767.1 MAG: hypothetical protein COW80_04155 [Candidatus Beckwithbacteria bacterium CG22_combo_CG10-13_8_21_14_all_01_47_9]PJA23045.1 MAG: hypothetical protein COX59_01415 [Candidatus Beckwithbacteria bacterium CG_4_10_14_0_2_um_filter_47_25]PJC66254.1 MAG: hypothetical prot
MKYINELNTASYFNKNTLQQVAPISDNALYSNIKRWLKQNIIIQLKRGTYVTNDYYIRLPEKQAYLEFIANKLKSPSYLSLEYVLQKYSLLTEGVYAFTSITLKKTNTYKNKLGLFTYSNISQNLFTGYKIVNKEGFQIKEASKAKALFDFLYLRLLSVKNINKSLIDSFRFNLDEFSQKDQKEFKSYVKLSKIKKLEKASLWLA